MDVNGVPNPGRFDGRALILTAVAAQATLSFFFRGAGMPHP